MSKIRINELARELEVKPSVILELLPELGVHDKKTHSSSLDDDLVLKIRVSVHGEGGELRQPSSHGPDGGPHEGAVSLAEPDSEDHEEPVVRASSLPPPLPPHVPTPHVPVHTAPAAEAHKIEH